MAHKHTAESNVVPLLLKGPHSALRLVELVKKSETRFVAVMPNFLFQQILVEVEPADRVFLFLGRVFLPNSLEDSLGFSSLLQKGYDLVDLVRNNVSVLVLV